MVVAVWLLVSDGMNFSSVDHSTRKPRADLRPVDHELIRSPANSQHLDPSWWIGKAKWLDVQRRRRNPVSSRAGALCDVEGDVRELRDRVAAVRAILRVCDDAGWSTSDHGAVDADRDPSRIVQRRGVNLDRCKVSLVREETNPEAPLPQRFSAGHFDVSNVGKVLQGSFECEAVKVIRQGPWIGMSAARAPEHKGPSSDGRCKLDGLYLGVPVGRSLPDLDLKAQHGASAEIFRSAESDGHTAPRRDRHGHRSRRRRFDAAHCHRTPRGVSEVREGVDQVVGRDDCKRLRRRLPR
eukprot:scaffold1102_cov256-Pinguiococcus_pyrenoidosus.AAC.28